jgi:isopentenyl-diphosphate delta-isomerase
MAQEQIVLVNQGGIPVGTAEKFSSHHENTPLHLAFSCYVFNDKGQILVTQRAHVKKVWPGVWSNSCCGHPAPGEDMFDAIRRRLDYELGVKAVDFKVILPKYIYKTPPFNGIVEHEFCPVYVARAVSEPNPNPDEIADYKWMSWHDYVGAVEADTGNDYSWWCKDQLKLIKNDPKILQYAKV